MASSEPIVCKPTAWFLCRAAIIFLMFAVFTVLFYIDGSTGYREDNVVYYVYQTFEPASKQFANMKQEGGLTPESWREYASAQKVSFPEDHSILPEGFQLPMAWPEILYDYNRVESLQWKQWWLDYSEKEGYPANPPEKAHDARSIREQWIFFYICGGLSAITLFFLIRTNFREITATEDAIISQDGRKVPYADMNRLDLRKWDNKGIAIIEYVGSSTSGKLRIDGLTYGGFKKENDQPAEKLMDRIRSKFSGELLEYTSILDEPDADAESDEESKPEP